MIPVVIGVIGLSSLAGAGSPSLETDSDADRTVPRPLFTGELEVNVVNLTVTVVDADGRPVTGLSPDNFRVYEDGREMRITNFEEIAREADGLSGGDTTLTAEGRAAEDGDDARLVTILFDNPSLQQRNRRRLIEPLEEFVRTGLARGDEFMIAVSQEDRLRVIHPFSEDELSLMAAFEVVANLQSDGEAVKSTKRLFKRSLYQTDLFQARRTGPGGGFALDLDYARTRGQVTLTEIEAIRGLEYDRIKRALGVIEESLRALAGVQGHKSLVWIGEDLAMRPAIDLYTLFYRQTQILEELLNLTQPAIWGEEMSLAREFQQVAAVAQASNATVFIIDASDRDREVANADYSPPSVDAITAADQGGTPWSPGVDLAELRDLTEGGEFMALATGGEAYGGTRNVDRTIERLETTMSSFYSIGYERPGPPDGRQHSVRVEVEGVDARVRHHEKIINRTTPQRLTDLAFSRLQLGIGGNPLDLSLRLGSSEPASEKGRYIQTVHLEMPIDRLVLMPDADVRRGQILVAVAVLDDDGQTAPPYVLRLSLSVPEADYDPGATARQSLRLMMRPDTRRIAVGVRDEVSGLEASQSIEIMPIGDLQAASAGG
jgi:VWFA-related protein